MHVHPPRRSSGVRSAMRPHLLALACTLCSSAAPAWALDYIWLGGNGNWEDPSRWTLLGIPGSDDRATISSGIVTMTSERIVGELTLAGGTLNGASLRVLGDTVFSGGTHSGAGTTDFVGRVIFNPGSRTFAGRAVNTSFETYWTGSAANGDNTIRFNGTVTLTNSGHWIDGNVHDNRIDADGVGTRTFINTGLYSKLGSGHSVLEPLFRNDGQVDVNAGRLSLAGGMAHAGDFFIAAGATLSFGSGSDSSGLAVFDGNQVSGGGRLMVDATAGIGIDVRITGTARHAGTLHVAGGQLDIAGQYTVAELVQTDGEVTGTGTLIVEGRHAMDAGSHTGIGTTRFLGDLVLGDGRRILGAGRTIESWGVTEWRDDVRDGTGGINDFRFQGQASWINKGSFNDRNNTDALISTGGGGGVQSFVNDGNYLKLGLGTTVVRPLFDNRGHVQVAAGRLSLVGGASHTGTFDIAEGATLGLGHDGAVNGTHVLSAGQLLGVGRLTVDGSPGLGTDARITGTGSFGGQLQMASGALDLPGQFTVARFEQHDGDVQGAGQLRVQGAAVMTGGRQSGSGSTHFDGALELSGNGSRSFALGRQVETTGITTWAGNTVAGGNTIVFDGANVVLRNRGSWIDANAHDTTLGSGGFGTGKLFVNAGTYLKQGASTTRIAAALHNEGELILQAGAVLFVDSTDFRNSGKIAGSGTVRTRADSVLASSGLLSPGASTGLLQVDGNLDLLGTSRLDLELTSTADFDRLAVSSELLVGGTLHIVNLGYTPSVGDQFAIISFAQRVPESRFAAVTWTGFDPGVDFHVSYNTSEITLGVTAVPEPGSWAMWLLGLAGLGVAARRLPRP